MDLPKTATVVYDFTVSIRRRFWAQEISNLMGISLTEKKLGLLNINII